LFVVVQVLAYFLQVALLVLLQRARDFVERQQSLGAVQIAGGG